MNVQLVLPKFTKDIEKIHQKTYYFYKILKTLILFFLIFIKNFHSFRLTHVGHNLIMHLWYSIETLELDFFLNSSTGPSWMSQELVNDECL